jgi:hypothetical protein
MPCARRTYTARPAHDNHSAAALGRGLQPPRESVQLQFAPDIGRAGTGASHRLVTIANR